MGAADGAIGILPQLELAELHAQGIDQQQSANQRIALAENQLDRFRRLNHADESGQNSEHSAFRARWHESGRWRLRIEAAIAGAVFRGEHAGLALEAEDRAVDIG